MFRRGILGVCGVFVLGCIAILVAPEMARGDGSIVFNGTTSKLQNNDADILAGVNDITVCVWVKAAGLGGNNQGLIFALDETAAKLHLGHQDETAHRAGLDGGF